MLDCDLRVKHEIIYWINGSTDVVLIGIEWVPVVNVIKLQVDAIVIVEILSKEKFRFVDKFEIVVGQVVDVIYDDNLN